MSVKIDKQLVSHKVKTKKVEGILSLKNKKDKIVNSHKVFNYRTSLQEYTVFERGLSDNKKELERIKKTFDNQGVKEVKIHKQNFDQVFEVSVE